MPAPTKCSDLLVGNPAGVTAAGYFRIAGEHRWAHFEGFREFMHACVIDGGFKSEQNGMHAVKSALPEAVAEVPASWKKSLRKGDWGVCHPDQVTEACKGPVRFDKACILLLATDIACKRNAFRALHSLDVFEHVTIHPAIYKLANAERWHTLRTMFPSRVKACELELLSGIKQRLLTAEPRDEQAATEDMAENFLKQALFGRPMTWKNATFLADALNEPVFGHRPDGEIPGFDCLPQRLEVRPLNDRSDGGKFTADKHCNQGEAPFVTLSEAKLAALRDAVERSATAALRTGRG
jgi:hypothetical protein